MSAGQFAGLMDDWDPQAWFRIRKPTPRQALQYQVWRIAYTSVFDASSTIPSSPTEALEAVLALFPEKKTLCKLINAELRRREKRAAKEREAERKMKIFYQE